jgi:DNA-binding transcriptional LysR family regulator
MKLHHIRNLLEVANKGSVRAASRSLGVAQSAISRSIQQLEKDLGATLFERRKKGVVLTPMGTLFLQRARGAVSELSRARDEIQQYQGGATGSVVACLSTTPHIALLPSVLPAFRKRYAAVRLHLIEGVNYDPWEPRLKDGSIDFYAGLAPFERPAPELVVEQLFMNQRFVVARAKHPLAKARSLVELIDAEWVISGRDRAETDLAALFRTHKLRPPNRLMVADSALSTMVLLAYTDAVAVVPYQWTDFAPTKALLHRIHVTEDLRSAANVLIRRGDMPLTPAAEYLCDLIRRAAGGRKTLWRMRTT